MRFLARTAEVVAAALLLALPAVAQYQIGDAQLSTLNGNIGAGYSGAYGNQMSSSHSLNVNGSASLSGFYYNPGFLTFSVTPYYDQSRANSNFRSVGDSSGVALSTSIFSGSHFPGSVNYSRDYNSSGTFSIPGAPEITTHGNADNLGIRWSEELPNLPNVSAFFTDGHSSSSIYGTDGMSDTASKSFGANSFYTLVGFHLTASYQHNHTDGTIPPFLEAEAISTSSTSDGYSFGASHKLPFSGGVSLGYNHSEFSAESQAFQNNGKVNNSFANLTFNPTTKLGLTGTVNYTDNLAGQLNEAILSAGGIGPPVFFSNGSHALDLNTTATYALPYNVSVNGIAGHREQTFLGQTYSSNFYGGGVSTSRVLFGGMINGMVRVADFLSSSTGNSNGSSSLSLVTTVNYARQFGLWNITTNFSYSQNQQTLLISYLSSFFTYGASIHRPIHRLRWNASFVGSHSGIPLQAGTSNNSESFSMGLGSRHLTGSGTFSRSNGNGLLTPLGVTQSPVPAPILTELILYGGKSYSFSVGSAPITRLIISGSYSASMGDTTSPTLNSTYRTKSANALVQYRFRQMGFTGGYSRLIQGFNVTGGPPFDASSFFVGVNRWFNFF